MFMETSMLGPLRSSAISESNWNYFAQTGFFGISLESGLTARAMFTFSLDFLRRKEVRTWASATQRNKATTMAARLSGPMLLMLDQSFLDMFATSRLRWDTEVFSDCRSLFKKFCSSITDAFLFPLRFYLHTKLISASLSLCQGQCFDLLKSSITRNPSNFCIVR